MEARQLLSSTAKPLTTFENGAATPDLAPVHLQGSGLAQAWNAVHATGVTNIVKFALNDTDHFAGSQKFTLKNTGTEDVTYTLANQGALVAYTLNPGSNFLVPAAELEYVSRSAEVKFAESSVKVAAGQEVVVSFEVTAPSALSARRLPIYSGFIKLDGSNGDKMSLPYLGMAGR